MKKTAKRNLNNSTLIKQKIIEMFNKKVKGKAPDSSTSNSEHDGKDGHWLETQMGVKHNRKNAPDIFGFEMKNNTTSKTTFGDWSADYYIFKDKTYKINRKSFLQIFGKPNPKKHGRFSWSGEPCPKINNYNFFGQKLILDRNKNIFAIYNFSKDNRKNKLKIVPKQLQKNKVILAKWNSMSLKNSVEKKFNNEGWFKCIKENGVYTKIVFGAPLNFTKWITGVEKGLIFFDSGMYDGNSRNYSQWRANNKYWESLIISTH